MLKIGSSGNGNLSNQNLSRGAATFLRLVVLSAFGTVNAWTQMSLPGMGGTLAEQNALTQAMACIQALPPGLQPLPLPPGTTVNFGNKNTVPGMNDGDEGATFGTAGAFAIFFNSEAGVSKKFQGLPVTLDKAKLTVVLAHEMEHCDPDQPPDPPDPAPGATPDEIIAYSSQQNAFDCDHLAIYAEDLLRACYLYNKLPTAEKATFACWNRYSNYEEYLDLVNQIQQQAEDQQEAQAEKDGVDVDSLPPAPWPCSNASPEPPCEHDLPCLDC